MRYGSPYDIENKKIISPHPIYFDRDKSIHLTKNTPEHITDQGFTRKYNETVQLLSPMFKSALLEESSRAGAIHTYGVTSVKYSKKVLIVPKRELETSMYFGHERFDSLDPNSAQRVHDEHLELCNALQKTMGGDFLKINKKFLKELVHGSWDFTLLQNSVDIILKIIEESDSKSEDWFK